MSLRPRRLLSYVLFVCSLSLIAGCGGEPPEKELQQADAAIAAAITSGAERYAPDELKAAREAVQRGRDAVTARDYRLALNHALDARDRAQTAIAETSGAIASARSAADMAIGAAVAAVGSAHTKLAALEAARTAPRALAAPREALAHGDARLQEARTAFGKGDFDAATSAAKEATGEIERVSAEIDELTAAMRKRR
jgi:hypothetical protein